MATPDALEPQRFNTLNPEETAELLQEHQQPQAQRGGAAQGSHLGTI